jgi:hypothetical protein
MGQPQISKNTGYKEITGVVLQTLKGTLPGGPENNRDTSSRNFQ